MRLGVQHRHIYLAPPTGMDRHWCARMFNVPEIHTMFGYDEPAGVTMGVRLATEGITLGMVRLVTHRIRIGFVLVFPPTDIVPFHEIGYAITEPHHRDAFTAIHALDAMGYYMWEHHGIERLGGRTRHDNRQAEAVVRRMGFKAMFEVEHLGHPYRLYAQDRPGWEARKARLESGEQITPSPAGRAFVFLRGAPCVPEVAERLAS